MGFFDERIPREIRDAYDRACDVLGPLDASFAWAEAFGMDVATLAELRAQLEAQIARDRELLAAQLAAYRRGELSVADFSRWVEVFLAPDALLRRAGIVLPSSIPPSR